MATAFSESRVLKKKRKIRFREDVPLSVEADPSTLVSRPDVFGSNVRNAGLRTGIPGFTSFRCDSPVTDVGLVNRSARPGPSSVYLEKKSHSNVRLGNGTHDSDIEDVQEIPPPEKVALKRRLNLKYYRSVQQNCVIVHLSHPCQFQLCGYLKVTVCYGKISIFGAEISSVSPKNSVILFGSNEFHSFLLETMETNSNDVTVLEKTIVDRGSMYSSDVFDLLMNIKKNDSDAVIQIEELPLPAFFCAKQYIKSYVFPITDRSFSFFSGISKLIKCAVDAPESTHYTPFKESEEWGNVPLGMRTVIIGGEGAGKSSLCKFLVNRQLNYHSAVLFLEFDIGQGEFTPPGSVAALVLREPILGPNFTHNLQPEQMIHLGDVDAVKCSSAYMRSVEILVKDMKLRFPDVPWVINTMGFCKGLGPHLAMSCIRTVEPTAVIQINCPEAKRNFNMNLTASEVEGRAPYSQPLHYQFYTVNSVAQRKKKLWTKREARERMLLSYFSSMLKPPYYSFNTVEPYCVSFSLLYIGVSCHITLRDVLRALNGCIVSLSEGPVDGDRVVETTDMPETWFRIVLKPSVQASFGLGLIRGIDVPKRELYLLTPIAPALVQRVRLICMSQVEVPAVVMLSQEGVEGEVPYVAQNEDKLALLTVRRVHRPPTYLHNASATSDDQTDG